MHRSRALSRARSVGLLVVVVALGMALAMVGTAEGTPPDAVAVHTAADTSGTEDTGTPSDIPVAELTSGGGTGCRSCHAESFTFPKIVITEDWGSTLSRDLLALENDGPAGISLTDTDSAAVWDITGGDAFSIGASGSPALELDAAAPAHSLVMTATGVGIGTTTPAKALHVTRDDGTTSILIQDTSPVRERRFLVDLENNGPNGVRLTNTETAVSWEFATAGADNFSISLVGTDGNEFSMRPSGRLLIGPGAQMVFDLKPNGDLTVDGSITDGSGTTLGDLAAENQHLRAEVADLTKRLDALEAALAELAGD